jgi:hypothetical protein
MAKQIMKYSEWLEEVKKLADDNYDYYSSHYSFLTAFDDGFTPEQAMRDCEEWINC